ncbi:hypothetical protein [Fusobacterium sp. PH5-44]|uniref:hypothetical protein n=1 Tax=unclassified Fusobacterium TaxID=2648384 RepID=UPI003D21C4ED
MNMNEKINEKMDEIVESDSFTINFVKISERIAMIGAVVGIVVLIFLNVSEINDQSKAENTLASLSEIRSALEKYYNKTKTYPELTKEGAWNNLKILDYYDKNGELVSFAEIYGKNILDGTFKNDKIDLNNTVRDIADFKNGTMSGGWNYDYTNQTGEIHANLPQNHYGQQIEWDEY